MALNVPQVRTSTFKRSGSASSLRTDLDEDLRPHVAARSRHNSDTSANIAAAAMPAPGILPDVKVVTALFAGKSNKEFVFDSKLLELRSPYWKRALAAAPEAKDGVVRTVLAEQPQPLAQTTWPDVDELSM